MLRPCYISDCEKAECGTKTVGVPKYIATVSNPPDDVLRDSAGNPILVNGEVVRKTEN